jgi:2,4-dienoyl-CoA reductase-like NADH-dependent reductase (Old Yellow Enzyme family)/thioredoxin reductase
VQDSQVASYPLLFSPRTIGGREARNRIVSTSHGTNLANPDGSPSDALIAYHAAKAAGGCAIVQMFGTASATPIGGQAPLHVHLWKPHIEPQLRKAAAAIKTHGALAMSQLTSMGRRTYVGADVIGSGPSDTGSQIAPEMPHILTAGEIDQMIADFASSAQRLAECGFDGCDLAFYNDQLADQFWNPATNKRTDRYGGSLENRMRFSIAVIDAIRATVGRDFIVGARVSGDDRTNPGLTADESFEIIRRLDRLGKLDYFTVVGGTIETYRARGYTIPSAYYPRKTFVDLAAALRATIGATLIVTGRITTPEDAEAVLASGVADFVGMTRALIADPELPAKAVAGNAAQIRVCMGSGEGCIDRLYFGRPVRCVQNATIGRELTWPPLSRAQHAQRVVVIGGGPAGMEAARTAARRGHDVVLLERTAALGGAIRTASGAPGWEQYGSIVDWLGAELERSGVQTRTQAQATVDMLREIGADHYVFATGAQARRPYVPGSDAPNVHTAADILARRTAAAGPRVMVVDETGYTIGPKTADYLATLGHHVEIITQQYALGETIGTTLRAALLERLLRAGVVITPMTALVAVDTASVRVRHVLTDVERDVGIDDVVVASGGIGDDALYQTFAPIARATLPSAQLHLIGDAYAPRHLRNAIEDGAIVGRAL